MPSFNARQNLGNPIIVLVTSAKGFPDLLMTTYAGFG